MTPFSVLHVCMGNICRSPMAERLLHQAARERVGDKVDELLLSQSAGTGGWHEGDPMNPPAARELRRRGGDGTGFTARKLRAEHLDGADLVLTATDEQDDPWGRGDSFFTRVAEEIQFVVRPFAAVLFGA